MFKIHKTLGFHERFNDDWNVRNSRFKFCLPKMKDMVFGSCILQTWGRLESFLMVCLELGKPGNIPKVGCILAGAPANRIHGRHVLENAPRKRADWPVYDPMMSPKKKKHIHEALTNYPLVN